MEATHMLRVEGGGANYGGSHAGFASHQDQRRHKLHALFDAIDVADLAVARQLFQALINLDAGLRSDALFAHIGKALRKGNIYAAQHFMRDMKAQVINAQTFPSATRSVAPTPAPTKAPSAAPPASSLRSGADTHARVSGVAGRWVNVQA